MQGGAEFGLFAGINGIHQLQNRTMAEVGESNSKDHQSGESMQVPPSTAAVCSGLRKRASRATETLAAVTASDLKPSIRKLLRDLCQPLRALDMHLFRVRQDASESGIVGIRYQSGFLATDEQLSFFHRFQLQLLSGRVQECLAGDSIALIRRGANSGGRMMTSLINELDCESYVLCPLLSDGHLKGMLGIACGSQTLFPDDRAFLELLRLNGAILLNHVIRVRRERAKSRKLRHWRRIADQACDFAVSVTRKGILVGATPFGMGEATPELNGLRLEDVLPSGFHRELRIQIARAVRTQTVRTCEFQIVLGVEGPRWYLARIEPTAAVPGAAVTLYLTDNNPDKELEARNLQLTEQLDRASRLSLLGQMSTEFAHQLNQPLQAILNYCNTTQRRIEKGTSSEEKTIRSLANIEKSVLHSAEIIQRIRDFVKFRSLRTEDVLLEEIVESALMMVMPTAHGRNGDITGPTGVAGIRVEVDSTQTTHVLVNLIVNALDACCQARVQRPRIDLRVSLDVRSPRVRLTVTDNGPGLPADDPEQVFRKFYSNKEEGLGMGLAISKDVCESQGGNLSAQNNENRPGCTFTVTLPIAGSDGEETAELDIIPNPPSEPS